MSGRRAKAIRRECSKAGVGKGGYRRVKKAYMNGDLATFTAWAKKQGLA